MARRKIPITKYPGHALAFKYKIKINKTIFYLFSEELELYPIRVNFN